VAPHTRTGKIIKNNLIIIERGESLLQNGMLVSQVGKLEISQTKNRLFRKGLITGTGFFFENTKLF